MSRVQVRGEFRDFVFQVGQVVGRCREEGMVHGRFLDGREKYWLNMQLKINKSL
jgi:hypothetical protein